MKKNYILLVLSLFVSGLINAQGIYHIQSHTLGPVYVLSKDSVLIQAGKGVYNYKIALFNPNTKDWSFLSQAYSTVHFDKMIMKNKNEGLGLVYDGTVYKTTDCWKTMNKVNGAPALKQVGSTASGYYGVVINYGQKGSLFYSEDGENWGTAVLDLSSIPTVANYGNKVVAVKNYQEIYVSYDGGKSYKYINNSTGPFGYPTVLSMTDTNTVIGYNPNASGDNLYFSIGKITKWIGRTISAGATVTMKNAAEGFMEDNQGLKFTSDSGKTWSAGIVVPSGSGGSLLAAGNILLNTGIMTKDKGLTWEPALPQFQGGGGQAYNDVDIKGSLGIMGTSSGDYAISWDGGKTFVPSAAKINYCQNIMAVKVLNDSVIYAGDNNGQIFVSKNKGKTWTQQYSNYTGLVAKKISVSADGKIIAMTRNGQPLVSSDFGAAFDYFAAGGGSHSQAVKPNGEILDISGHNNGGSDVSIDIYLLNPLNWQKTLVKEVTISGLNIIDIVMKDDNVGYILAQNKTTYATVVIQTTDGWKTYSEKGSIAGKSTENYLSNWPSTFIFGDTLVIAGKGLKYYHYSTNQGQTWNMSDTLNFYLYKQDPYNAPTIQGVHFFSAGKYFITPSNGGAFLNAKSSLVSTGIVNHSKDNVESAFIYPNPLSGKGFYINEKDENIEVKIYDILGSVVKISRPENGYVEIESSGAGLYFVEVYKNNQKLYTTKLIRQ